jgi:hypothetical protein
MPPARRAKLKAQENLKKLADRPVSKKKKLIDKLMDVLNGPNSAQFQADLLAEFKAMAGNEEEDQ